MYESVGRRPLSGCRIRSQEPDGRQLRRLLRARRERPRNRRATEKRDELPPLNSIRSGGLQFSLGQKLRMIALHKSQQPVATTSVALYSPFPRARWLLFMTDIVLLITAVVVAKSYVAPLSEDIDLK
jgi:hypothetical protein